VSKRIFNIALYGTPGAGKSTTADLIEEIGKINGIYIKRIKLADPLYKAQAQIYKIAGKKIDFYSQDGELLNFLGYYLRKLNPSILLNEFDKQIKDFEDMHQLSPIRDGIVLCDDMRSPDFQFMMDNKFLMVRVIAENSLCSKRREQRGDLSSLSNILYRSMVDWIVPNIDT